ncbi:histone-lysine N-methyltransferase SETMAR [Trichonephila clavipes]|nr:histone-lysine N-methyltransferase SETMAR [Trichonephila clavipes]
MLSRILTGDETWVSHITPQSKQRSMEWPNTSSPAKVKAKQTLSKRKIMARVFWEWHCVLLVDFMPHGTKRSTQVLAAELYGSSAEHFKTNGVAFCQKVFCSSTITPDLDLRDSTFFWYLKHSLGGKHFRYKEEVKAAVKSWMSNQAADFFEESFQDLILRYDKCINKLDKYVKK